MNRFIRFANTTVLAAGLLLAAPAFFRPASPSRPKVQGTKKQEP